MQPAGVYVAPLRTGCTDVSRTCLFARGFRTPGRRSASYRRVMLRFSPELSYGNLLTEGGTGRPPQHTMSVSDNTFVDRSKFRRELIIGQPAGTECQSVGGHTGVSAIATHHPSAPDITDTRRRLGGASAGQYRRAALGLRHLRCSFHVLGHSSNQVPVQSLSQTQTTENSLPLQTPVSSFMSLYLSGDLIRIHLSLDRVTTRALGWEALVLIIPLRKLGADRLHVGRGACQEVSDRRVSYCFLSEEQLRS